MTKYLGLLAILTLTACADDESAEKALCNHDGKDLYESEGYTEDDCFDLESGEMDAGPAIAAKIDIQKPFVDLSVLGADWLYNLGGDRQFTAWDPLVMRSGPLGYNLLGGSEDWDPEHAVAFITKVLNVDVEGDGIVDKQYSAIPIPDMPEGSFFQGNVANFDNADCGDIVSNPESEYAQLAGCWMMFVEECGEEFTAWDMEEANRGECGLSVRRGDGVLLAGPEVSTF